MLVYGRNVIREILKNGKRKVYKIFIFKAAKDISDILQIARSKNISIELKERSELNEMTNTDSNQGVVADIEDIKLITLKDFLQKHKDKEKISVCILDEIEDPHNTGAIIRSCEIFGVYGIILPSKRAAPVNDTVYKVSSGAVEYIDIIQVSNINDAIYKLKDSGFWIYGFDIDAQEFLDKIKFDNKCVLVFGSEGKGLRELVKKNCDFLVKIKQKGKINSLNVSNAAAIVFYEVMKQFEKF